MSGWPGSALEGLPFGRTPQVARFEELMFGSARLEELAEQARRETRKNFGRTMRLFAPLYLSNECVNTCHYCGFSKDNPIRRVTLKPEEVEAEARHLAGVGFRSVLLVSGEHPREVPVSYMVECVRRTVPIFPSVAIEVAPLEVEEYRQVVAAGAEGLVLYQESYDRAAYAEMHVSGPKRNFDERLEGPERGYAAGFRRIGLGVLIGLADWRKELTALAGHISHLMKVCWGPRSPWRYRGCGRRRADFNRGWRCPTVILSGRSVHSGWLFHKRGSCSPPGNRKNCGTG